MSEQFSNRTRLVIAGSKNKNQAIKLLLHCVSFAGKEIDYITKSATKTTENDFILFEAEDAVMEAYNPNIALITAVNDENLYKNFIATVVSGGIVVYNEEDSVLVKLIEEAPHFFRKIPYKTPDFTLENRVVNLATDMGDIPLQTDHASQISYIEGVKHICQQLGIMEEEFYEAVMHFEF